MKKNWHRQYIIAAVRERGKSLAQLSIDNGYAKGTLISALGMRYRKAHKIIADFLGLKLNEIWPEYYDKNDRTIVKPMFKDRRAA